MKITKRMITAIRKMAIGYQAYNKTDSWGPAPLYLLHCGKLSPPDIITGMSHVYCHGGCPEFPRIDPEYLQLINDRLDAHYIPLGLLLFSIGHYGTQTNRVSQLPPGTIFITVNLKPKNKLYLECVRVRINPDLNIDLIKEPLDMITT